MAPVSFFRSRMVLSAAALGLLLGIGCSGKKQPIQKPGIAAGTIQGNITYVRIPVTKDPSGVPTGLETNPANDLTLPARGVAVRAYQYNATTSRWVMKQIVYTDGAGHYSMVVPAGDGYTVQVESTTVPFISSPVSIIADPNGLASTLPQSQRPLYLLRASPSGVAATPSTPAPTSSVTDTSTSTVNFSVDLSTDWQVGSTSLAPDGSAPAFTSATFESTPSGSRILAILDDVYAFSVVYGNPTPGASLDLHYLMGRSEPRGTYIEYNILNWVQPSGVDLAYDGFSDHFFGSIRGGSSNDDAWDESVIFAMLGRASLFRQADASQYSGFLNGLVPVQSPIDGLSPDVAMFEGLPLIMAANLLKSPYLADTDGTSALVSLTDIRDLSTVAPADIGPYSPRTLAAALWEIDLKANGITSPGTVTNWNTIAPTAIPRLFALVGPATGTYSPLNIYLQLAKLKNTKTSAEPVDLAAIFNDTTINAITSPFNLPWPQPTSTVFAQAWTTSAVNGPYSYSGTLSMSDDHLVNGAYPNESYKELVYLGVSQVTDQAYQLTLQTTPSPLPAGATIQVTVFSGAATQSYTFSGTSPAPITFTLAGNNNTTTPAQYPVRVRLLSPTTLQSDIPFTLQLAPAPPGTLRGPVLGH